MIYFSSTQSHFLLVLYLLPDGKYALPEHQNLDNCYYLRWEWNTHPGEQELRLILQLYSQKNIYSECLCNVFAF